MKTTLVRCLQLLTLVCLSAPIGCSCTDSVPPPGNGKPASIVDCRSLPPEAIARNNRGVGLMGQFSYEEARKIFAELSDQFPGCPELQVNLAIAELNVSQNGKIALPLLAKVLQADPKHARANYLGGILYVHEGRFAEAIPSLERAAEADPRDPYVVLQLATCHEPTSLDKAFELYRKAIELDPLFRTAYYRLFDLSRLKGDSEQSLRYLEEFKKLDNHPRAHVFEFKYTHMGPKADAIRFDGEKGAVADLPKGELFRTAMPLAPELADVAWADGDGPSSITIAELDREGQQLLFMAGAVTKDGQLANAVLLRANDSRFVLDSEHPLADVTGVNAALWGDFDNDGLTDVYLCRRGPNQLWRQTAPNAWQDVTEASQTAGGDSNTVDGAMFDADHDGDLDLFLVNADGPNELLSNNLDGTFRPLAREAGITGAGKGSRNVIPTDLDGDRDLDLIVLNAELPHDVFINDRIWTYRKAAGFAVLTESRIDALVAGDLNADGQVELYSAGENMLIKWQPDASRNWQSTALAPQERRGERPRLALADVDGDGRLELIGGEKHWSVYQIRDPSSGAKMPNEVTILLNSDISDLAGWTIAVIDVTKGPSIVGWQRGKAPVVWQPGAGRFAFLGLAASGKTSGGGQERSNASGIGNYLEVRYGNQTTVLSGVAGRIGPGQSLQPAVVGLAGRERADYVRILWTDGVWQSELDVPTAKLHRIEETNRIPTSCPVLFVWNGERFEFVSDLLGVGGLGYFVAPGEYAPPNPRENFLLPHGCLVEQNGCLRLKLTEPMEELTYLDYAGLVAYDLPPGWQMTLDERMGITPPLPTGEPFFYRRLIEPIQATNDRGQDITATIAKRDAVAAPPGALDHRFVGMLSGQHVVQLTFDEPLDEQNGQPLLVADGWIEYPYSQTAFAAWQANRRFEAPTLEARAPDGQWQVVHREFGYPAGMPRQMSLPLSNLPRGTTELRLRTNQEIYWDTLAVAFAEPCPAARRIPLKLMRAELREAGFTPRVVHDQRRPFFDDAVRVPLANTQDPAGFYTALGHVDELLADRDDALAIFGPGEEIEIMFEAPPERLQTAWRRELVLEVRGWCKDRDLYTEHGETVEPLPGEKNLRRDALHSKFNTRYQSGR